MGSLAKCSGCNEDPASTPEVLFFKDGYFAGNMLKERKGKM